MKPKTLTVFLMMLTLGILSAYAAPTPIVVWDGDFGTSEKTGSDGKTYTLTPQNASVQSDGSLKIGSGTQSAYINLQDGSNYNLAQGTKISVLMEYENATAQSSVAAPLYLQADAYFGLKTKASTLEVVGDGWGTTYPTSGDTVTTMPSSGCILMVYPQGSGVMRVYSASTRATLTEESTGGNIAGLKYSNKNLQKIGIGGTFTDGSDRGLANFEDLVIKRVAVFASELTTSEAATYLFPSETQIINVDTDTAVSAINPQIDAVNYKATVVSVADGVKITVDEAFGNVSVSSEGSIMLSAESQPDESYFSNADFSGIKGGLLRSWVGPDVIGYNFCSDGYNTSYYYSGAANTSSALAKGTWYANGQSKNGSAKVYSEDGLTVLTWSAPSVWSEQAGISSGTFIQGYLDDNGGNPQVDVSALPFEKYDVIIYCSSGSEGAKFQAKYVNGQYYTWDDEKGETVVAEGAGDNWGSAKTSSTPIYGINCIRINNLTGPLTIRGGQRNSTLGGGCISAIQIIPAEVEIDATEGFTPDATRLENIRKDYRDVTIKGSGENGATLDFGSTTATLTSHIVFDGGTHTVTYNNSGTANIEFANNPQKPVFETINGAKVKLYSIDLSGWNGSAVDKVPKSNILVRNGTMLSCQPNAARTFYYQGRFTIEPGATLRSYYTHANNVFRMNGGAVEGCEQIYVPSSDTQMPEPAVIDGCDGNTGLKLADDATQGLGIYVGGNSTLNFNLAIAGDATAPLGKWGEGTLNLNGDMSGYLGTLTIHAGTVTVTTATTLANVVNNATLAFAYGENGLSLPTFTSYSGSGHIQIDVSALTPESGETYVLMPNAALDVSKVELIGLNDSNFHVGLTEDGVVLTEETTFNPTWTGGSSIWSATVFDGREGDTTDIGVIFADSDGNDEVVATVSGDKSVASLAFIANDTAYTLSGNKITASGAINVSGASPVVISAPIEAGSVSLAADTSLTFSTTDLTIPDGGFSGAGTLILDPGAGNTYTMSGGNTSYTGEAVIKSGTVKMGNGTSFGNTGRASSIRVKGGAALDANNSTSGAYGNDKNKVILETGATFCTSVSQGDYKQSAFTKLTLEGDATVDATGGNLSISQHYNYDYTQIELGSHTLTKTGSNEFFLSCVRILGTGMLDIANGTVVITSSYYNNRNSEMSSGTLRVGSGGVLKLQDYAGAQSGGGTLTVKNLELAGSVTRSSATYSTLTVTGELSGSGTTPMLTLADGATLKPKSLTEKLTVTESLTLSGSINVDISGLDLTGKFKLPIITSPTQITAEQVASFDRGANSENWKIYSEETSAGVYEFGVKIESIPWTGTSGVWTDTGFNGGDNNYVNDGSQKVIFPDDDDSSATPLEVTVTGEKNVDTLGVTADHRAVTITGDAITAGTVAKSGQGIATVKSALTVGTELAVTDGILILNPTDTAVDTSGMEAGTLVVYVADGVTNTISVAITATKLIKLGPGVLALSNANNISGGTSLDGGQIISTVVPANSVAIAAGATFTLKDVQWVSGNRFSGEGTLELYLSSGTRNFGGSEALDLPGKLKVTRVGSGWPVFKGGFSPRSELEITEGTSAGLVMDVGYIGEENAFRVKNLSGGGTINPQNGATGGNRFIDTLQTAPAEFKGNFMAGGTSGGGAERSAALIVRGDEHSYGLTLSGASTTKGDLIITDNGKVIFSETGSWANGAIKVNDSGCLEVRNSAAMTSATLTLNDGATVVIPLVNEAILPLAAATINASGNVYVDLTETGITPTSDPITVMIGYTGEDVSGLKPRGCTGTFSVDEGTVTFTPGVSAPWTGGSATWSATGIENSSESTGYAELTAVTFGTIGAPETEATITIEGTRTPATIVFNGGEGTTYKLTGGALKPVGAMTIQSGTVEIDTEAVLNAVTGAGALIIGEGGVVAIALAGSIAGDIALSGTGTLVLDGFLPDETLRAKLVDEAWQGTVWIKNIGESVLMEAFADYGNANSSVKFTNVHAYADGADCLWTLVLEDDAETGDYAWYDNGGASDGEVKVAKLIGTGTFYDDGASGSREKVTFTDVSGFAGSISTTGKRIGLGGTNELDASNAGSVEVVAEKTLAIAAGKGLAATRVLIAGTVEMTASSLVLGEVAGTGTIRCAALLNVAPTFGTDWTGSVELPVVAADGLNLNAYGRSGSKVVVGGITGGYLHAESGYQVAPDLELQGDMLITDASVRAYTFQTISGSGNFSFDTGVAITSISIAKIAAGYTGIVTNNTSATLTIGGIALDAAPTMGEKVLSAGGTGTIANTTSTVDGVDYTIFQDTTDRNLYMAVVSITKDSTTTYYKTAQAALNTLTGEATLAGMAPVPPFTWAALTDLAVPDAVTSIDMAGIRDFTNWSFDAGTTVAVRPTLAEVVAGEIEVTNVPDGVTAITVYRYGSDEVFDQIAISAGQGKLVIDTEVAGTYSTYLNNTATPNADSANASWQSFNLRNAVTEPDSVHFLFADAATDIAEIAEVVALTSITVNWGSTTHNNANFGGSGDVAITTKPYLVVTTSDNVIVAISAEGDSAWTASGSTTFNFVGEQLLFANARYRFQFADNVDGLAVGDEFTEAKIARCNCRWHASGRIAEEDTRCSGNNTYSINAQITVGIVRTVNYRKTISDDAQWSTEKPSGWEDGAAPYIAITAAEDSTPTFTFDEDVTAGVLTADGAVTIKKDANATPTFGSIVAKNGATLYNLGSTPVSVTEGTVTLFDWATASVASPVTGAAIRYAGTSPLTSLPFVTDSGNVQGRIILAQPFANELFQPVGNKALVGFEAGANVTVTRMVLGNQGGVVQNFRQTGGTVTINGDGSVEGTANSTAPLLIGHWNSTVVYDMLGGTIDLPNGAVRLAWGNVGSSSGSATWNIGGGEIVATVNTKGIRAGSEREDMPGTLNLKPNGVLNLRDGGIQFMSQNATLNLMGGKIVAAADLEIANAKANGTVLASGTETIIDTGDNTVTLSAALTGSGTLVKRGSGTLIVTGSLDGLTGKIRAEAGEVNFGSLRDFAKVEVGAGVTQVQVNQTQSEYLNGNTTFVNVPDSIASIRVNKFDDETAYATSTGDGGYKISGETMTLGGKATLYDFTFTPGRYTTEVDNTGSRGGTLNLDGSSIGNALDSVSGNLYVRTHPYVDVGNYPTEFTVAVYGTMPQDEYNTLIAFGRRNEGTLALVKGSTENDVNLIWAKGDGTGENYQLISSMRAKASTEENHLYVFEKTANSISVYLDGREMITVTSTDDNPWPLGNNGGFQVGSVLQGAIDSVATRPSSTDPAMIAAVRIYGEKISADVMAALKAAFPFVDAASDSERTLDAEDGHNSWYGEEIGTWTNTPDDVEDAGHLPRTNANVTLTVEGDVEQRIDVVLNANTVDEPNIIGDLHITGSQALTIRKSIGGHPVSVSGILTNDVSLTVHYGAIDLAYTALYMGEDATLTFELSELINDKRDSDRVYLTGVCDNFGTERVTYSYDTTADTFIKFKSLGWDSETRRYYVDFKSPRAARDVWFDPIPGADVTNVLSMAIEVYYTDGTETKASPILTGDTLHFKEGYEAVVLVPEGEMALAGYDIPAGVTVIFEEAITNRVSGAGTIVMDGCWPRVSLAAVEASFTDTANWTGTVDISNVNFGNASLPKLGNANSTIRLSGCSLYPQSPYEVTAKLEIYGDGLDFRGISSGSNQEVIFDQLIGSGSLMNTNTTLEAVNYLRINNADDFTGAVTNLVGTAGGTTMLFGAGSSAEGSVVITTPCEFNLVSPVYASTNLVVNGTLKASEPGVVVTAEKVLFDSGIISIADPDAYPFFELQNQIEGTITIDLVYLPSTVTPASIQVMRVNNTTYLPDRDHLALGAGDKVSEYALVKDADGRGWSLVRKGFYIRIR